LPVSGASQFSNSAALKAIIDGAFSRAPQACRRGKRRSCAIFSDFFSKRMERLLVPKIRPNSHKVLINKHLNIVNNFCNQNSTTTYQLGLISAF
jgi:hypothetical protein